MRCTGNNIRKIGNGAEERIRTADLEVNSIGLQILPDLQTPALTRLSHLGTRASAHFPCSF
jgi:hypothetical protein